MRPAHLTTVLDKEFLSTLDGHHTPVMLWGAPGVGKSQIISQIAARHNAPLIDIRLSQMEPSDLRGIPFRDGDRVEWAIPSMLPNEKTHGANGILFLDEITSAPPSVSAAAYQLILDRKLGDYEVPKGWAIFAAGNRQGDRGVTYTMPAPLANRFSHFDFEVNVGSAGDVYERTELRKREVLLSVDLLRQILKKMPRTGSVRTRIPDILHWKIPAGETYVKAESGRGEYGYYMVSDGSEYPRRVHVRGASYTHAMSLLEKLSVGITNADVFGLMVSLQTCPPEIER